METEYDENVLEYWNVPSRNYIVKLQKDDGLDCDSDVKNTLPSHLVAFILSYIERLMNNFIRETNRFYNSSVYYDLYIEIKFWEVLDKTLLVGKKCVKVKVIMKQAVSFTVYLKLLKNIV